MQHTAILNLKNQAHDESFVVNLLDVDGGWIITASSGIGGSVTKVMQRERAETVFGDLIRAITDHVCCCCGRSYIWEARPGDEA